MKKIKPRTFSGTKSNVPSEREMHNRAIARKAAQEGIVLLKNEHQILPISCTNKIALFGSGVSDTIKGGTGSGDVNERDSVSIFQGMKNAGYEIVNEEWIDRYHKKYLEAREKWRDDILEKVKDKNETAYDFFYVYTKTPFIRPEEEPIKKYQTEYAIYVISRVAGEGADRYADKGDYYLTDNEENNLKNICELYKNVVIVINTGGLIDLSFMDRYENIYGLIYMVQAGMEGGNALADCISGKVTPSGKMTDTWAYLYEDFPNALNYSHNNGNVQSEKYDEGIYVGYRYFDTFEKPVRYCFGYGLSYTKFDVQTKQVDYYKDKIQFTVSVKNIGNQYKGKDVVQVYASCAVNNSEKEYRRLVAFEKSKELQVGEEEEIILEVSLDMLTSYDEKEPGWVLEQGNYGFWIGTNLEDSVLVAKAEVDKTCVLKKTRNVCILQETLQEYHCDVNRQKQRLKEAFEKSSNKLVNTFVICTEDIKAEKIVYKNNSELYTEKSRQFVDQLTEEQLVQLSAGDPGKGQGGNLGAAGISVPGSAGETSRCAQEQGLASIVLADGPAGLRLMKYYHVDNGQIVHMPFEFSLEGGFFCKNLEQLPGERYYQYCTAIPVGTLLAQTWNKKLLTEVGIMIGQEMEEFGVTLWLAPGMNIHRNPLCGRNFEYYSEDPYLSGIMAAFITYGVQKNNGCGTTIKHFACNNQEDNRMASNSILSERTLREIYLKPFEIAVKKSQPMAVMTSYNLINGVHAANNYDLCTNILRNEWGFEGLVMTDWTTTEVDETCTASGCMRAGNDLIMPGNQSDFDNIYSELESGTLNINDLKACICRLTDVIWKSNQYEND